MTTDSSPPEDPHRTTTEIGRFGSGAPNETRFGFVQSTRRGNEIWVAGQVGKDNRTGRMIAATSLDEHVANALSNVRESASLGLRDGEELLLTSIVVHVAGEPGVSLSDRIVALRQVGVVPTIAIGVPALSSPDYAVEISATARARAAHPGHDHGPGKKTEIEMRDGSTGPMIEVVEYDHVLQDRMPGVAGMRVDDVVTTGGHVAPGVAVRPQGDHPDIDLVDQLSGAIEALDVTLRKLASGLDRVTSMHLYVRPDGPLDFDRVCEAHRSAMGHHPVAATLILVDQLPVPGASVMVTATAN